MAILDYTTTVSVDKTIADIGKILRGRVATLATHYGEDGTATGLQMTVRSPHGPRTFLLPVDAVAVLAALKADPEVTRPSYLTQAHAQRVAWRIAKDWLAAQCALVDARMASMDQVMLPYLLTDGEHTLYDNYKAREQSALEVS